MQFCDSTEDGNSRKISFHKLPAADWKREKWIELLNLDPTEISPWAHICSKHFLETDFIDDSGPKRRLFPSAMPYLSEQIDEEPEVPPPKKLKIEPYLEEVEIQMPLPIRAQSIERVLVTDNDNYSNEQPTCSQNDNHNDVIEISLSPIEPSLEETSSQQSHQYNVIESDVSSICSADIDLAISKKKVKKVSLKKALSSYDDDPQLMKLQIKALRESVVKNRLKIKTLTQNLRRKTKKLASLNEIISNLKFNNFISEETISEVSESIGGFEC